MSSSRSSKTTRGDSTNTNSTAFETFFQGWLVRQEHFHEELQSTLRNCHESRDDDLKDLISRVLSHYQEYYEEKSRMANRNVFLVFSPTWFTSFERAFFWIAGFKPALAFQIVALSVDDLTEEQRTRLDRLKDETAADETELGSELARIQESVATPPLMEVAGHLGTRIDGTVYNGDTVIEALRVSMEMVLASADVTRTRTAVKVVEILRPVQNVKFLAAATELQLCIRRLGFEREADVRQTRYI